MSRFALLAAAAVLAGCGPVPVQVADTGPRLVCPVNHTASCDTQPGQRQIDAATCVCVRNHDLNRMFRRL